MLQATHRIAACISVDLTQILYVTVLQRSNNYNSNPNQAQIPYYAALIQATMSPSILVASPQAISQISNQIIIHDPDVRQKFREHCADIRYNPFRNQKYNDPLLASRQSRPFGGH